MRKLIGGAALALVVLAATAMPGVGGAGTAEAAIHPIVQSDECAKADTPGALADPAGQIGNPSAANSNPGSRANGNLHPWQAGHPNAQHHSGNAQC